MFRSSSFFLVILLLISAACTTKVEKSGGKIMNVSVSIAPQAYIVKRIGADLVKVNVMVPPAASPETYEPGPVKMAELQRSKIYFTVGMPFETRLLEKIKSGYDGIYFADMGKGAHLRKPEKEDGHDHGEEEGDHDRFDPHIWLDPVNLIKMTENTVVELVKFDPMNKEKYIKNLMTLKRELQTLNDEMVDMFKKSKGMAFMVHHPAWGYLADRYGFKQMALEIEGKEPTVAGMTRTIEFIKKNGITKMFTQSQSAVTAVDAIKIQTGLDIVELDPLKEDVIENIRKSARLIKEGLVVPKHD
jgi:zinc transport system substrate-binding protein